MAEYIVYYSVEDTDELMPYKRERIVRCRDCKYYENGDDRTCEYFGADWVKPDGFCAWGEHKEN